MFFFKLIDRSTHPVLLYSEELISCYSEFQRDFFANGEMMKKWTTVLLLLLSPTICFASSATDRLKKAFNIRSANTLDEYTLRNAILKAVPIGSSIDSVLKRLAAGGLDYQGTCFAGDESAIKCQLESVPGTKKANDPNFVFYFVFNNENKVSDVIVWRWYLDIAKTFISTYKKPDYKITLKSGLGVGSTVAELEKVYGRWEMDAVGFWEIGWPITVSFCSKDDQCSLTVGIEFAK
jgi:hypothetical protein